MKRKNILFIFAGLMLIILYGLFDPDLYLFPKCPFRALTGYLCPGCGSQRAMHQLLHGDPVAAMRLNPLFIPGIVYVLFGYASPLLFPESSPEIQRKFYGMKAAYVALGVILVFWVGRNLL